MESKIYGFTEEEVRMVKSIVDQKAKEPDIKRLLYQARRTGLDPIIGQIHLVVRSQKNKQTGGYEQKATVQAGIDGLRTIAERTGKYAGGPAPTYEYRDGIRVPPLSATATVIKLVGEHPHEVSAVAFYDEYVQKGSDGKASFMWSLKPHIMLGKCAEALALRKAFPTDISGIYTTEEMSQADNAANGDGPPKTGGLEGSSKAVLPPLPKKSEGQESADTKGPDGTIAPPPTTGETPSLKVRLFKLGIKDQEQLKVLLMTLFGKTELPALTTEETKKLGEFATKWEAGDVEPIFVDGGCEIIHTNAQALRR